MAPVTANSIERSAACLIRLAPLLYQCDVRQKISIRYHGGYDARQYRRARAQVSNVAHGDRTSNASTCTENIQNVQPVVSLLHVVGGGVACTALGQLRRVIVCRYTGGRRHNRRSRMKIRSPDKTIEPLICIAHHGDE